MPRYVISPTARSVKHDAFVKKLVQEFTSSSANVQPLILEEEIPSTNSRHVHVVWDRWKELEDEQRSAVISDAYTEAEGPEAAKAITIADGLTPQEAYALGLLSFKVVPVRKKNDPISFDAYEQAKAKEARRTLRGTKSKELRYARLEDAQQAFERLQAVLPHSSWAVVQELATES
jgi:hypothetical protein